MKWPNGYDECAIVLLPVLHSSYTSATKGSRETYIPKDKSLLQKPSQTSTTRYSL